MDASRGLTWDMSLETGDEFIDRQHLRLYALVNDTWMLGDSCTVAMAREALLRLLEEIEIHLAAEHDLLEAAGHPELSDFRSDGERFCGTFASLATPCLVETGRSLEPVLNFTQEWLTDHVTVAGKSFARYRTAFAAAG